MPPCGGVAEARREVMGFFWRQAFHTQAHFTQLLWWFAPALPFAVSRIILLLVSTCRKRKAEESDGNIRRGVRRWMWVSFLIMRIFLLDTFDVHALVAEVSSMLDDDIARWKLAGFARFAGLTRKLTRTQANGVF